MVGRRPTYLLSLSIPWDRSHAMIVKKGSVPPLLSEQWSNIVKVWNCNHFILHCYLSAHGKLKRYVYREFPRRLENRFQLSAFLTTRVSIAAWPVAIFPEEVECHVAAILALSMNLLCVKYSLFNSFLWNMERGTAELHASE